MNRMTISKLHVFGIATLIVLLLVNSALSYRNTQRLYDDARRVGDTREVMRQIDNVLLSLVEAQDAYRGYVATGSEQFLKPYNAAVGDVSRQMTGLQGLTSDNADQKRRIDRLKIAVAAFIEHIELGVVMIRERGVPATRAFVAIGEGQHRIEAVKARIGEIRAAEEKLLQERNERRDDTRWFAIAVNLAVTVLGLCMMIAFVRLLERAVRNDARAAAQIQVQRQLLHSTLLSIGDGVIATDASGRVTFVNPIARELTGWTPEDAAGKHLKDVFRIVNEVTREPVDNPALRALLEGTIVGLANHTVLIAKDGTERPIDDSAVPIRTDAGLVTGAVLVFRDITARHQAAAELAAANRANAQTMATLDAIVMNAPVGIGLFDNDLRPVRVNDALARINALPAGPARAGTDFPGEVLADLRRVLRAGEPILQKEVVVQSDDGTSQQQHWFVNYYPVRDTGGEMLGVGATVLDVTSLKQAENALRESESRLRFVMSSMPQKIFTARPNGEVDYFNPEWISYTGLQLDAIKDWGWAQFIHPDDLEQNLAAWKASLASGEPFRFEHRFRRADGAYRWHSTIAVALKDAAGNVILWVGSNSDIHEERQTANELRRLAAELSEADARKDEFLATLAHELRNPLAPIRNGLNLIRSAGADREQLEQAQSVMDRQLTHLVRLVDDLMDVSRISRGKIELRKQPVEILAIVNSAVETSRSLIEKMGHALSLELPDHPIVVDADLTRLAQVFSNLLNNAAKYTDAGGSIRLAVAHQGDAVEVSVADNGIGIPANKLDAIFEMFTQVDHSLEKSQGGLGIGLTLVRRLVEMHGGTVVARSEGSGMGSTIVVRLPIAIDPVSRSADARPAVEAPNQGLRILIVDDNRDSADSLAMVLQLMGHDTRTAYDGLEGVALATDFRPDAILMDIGLPKLNGYEACMRIRERPEAASVVIVAITGWGQDADRRRSQMAGFNHHMVKPIDPDALAILLAGITAGNAGFPA